MLEILEVTIRNRRAIYVEDYEWPLNSVFILWDRMLEEYQNHMGFVNKLNLHGTIEWTCHSLERAESWFEGLTNEQRSALSAAYAEAENRYYRPSQNGQSPFSRQINGITPW